MESDDVNLPGTSTNTPCRVHFVNNSFVVFDRADADTLRDRYRMLADFGSSMEQLGSSSSNACYSYLLPEQVAISLEHGFINLLRLKWPVTTGNEEFVVSEQATKPEDECLELARRIVLGRKKKNLKRKINTGSSVPQIVDVSSITDEELDSALKEVQAASQTRDSVMIRMSSSHYDNYESIEFPEEFEDPEFRIRKVVFRDLWSRGFFITSGIRFGCHYLVYKGLPGSAHADFMVRCVDSEVDHSSSSLLSFARTSNQVCKKALIAFVSGGIHPQYLLVQSYTPLLSQDLDSIE
ncbi:hypothetical protein PFISCL1PPCAC_24654 [Pristionchus fissidentatus]|uniref:tRNA-intron lyase n=1 Tax=Pristionchus fissidentatus TaxID=1538716 RepID=A0AAV5WUC6_9BILA|nr:hypothetical protein PFISCL1PPCAC_24654 [Pristionchus fissidentatus]